MYAWTRQMKVWGAEEGLAIWVAHTQEDQLGFPYMRVTGHQKLRVDLKDNCHFWHILLIKVSHRAIKDSRKKIRHAFNWKGLQINKTGK